VPSSFQAESVAGANAVILRHTQCSVELALANVSAGGGPFGAVIARGSEILAQTANAVLQRCDPTAHAEVEVLRAAGARAGTPDLSGWTLYSSCEPCPMCLAAALWARVDRVYFAAPHTEAVRAGFADTAIAEQLYGGARPAALPPQFLQQVSIARASAPFDAWLALPDPRFY